MEAWRNKYDNKNIEKESAAYFHLFFCAYAWLSEVKTAGFNQS